MNKKIYLFVCIFFIAIGFTRLNSTYLTGKFNSPQGVSFPGCPKEWHDYGDHISIICDISEDTCWVIDSGGLWINDIVAPPTNPTGGNAIIYRTE